MHNYQTELNRAIQNRIGIACEVIGDFEIDYGNLYIRSIEPEYRDPQGWLVHIEKLNETLRLEFKFDDSAGLLCKFYVTNLATPEINAKVLELRNKFTQEYFSLNFISDDILVSLENLKIIDSPLNFKIKAKGRIQDLEKLQFMTTNIVIDFLLLAVFPLIPSHEDQQFQDYFFELGLPEGASKKVVVNRYERDPRNRLACIRYHGKTCKVCGFDFGQVYGEFAADYIHVHHLVPVSQMTENYAVDPINDLVPLCPNCHSAIHISNPPLTPDELMKRLLK